MKHLHFDTLYYGKPLFDRALVIDSTPFIMATTDASGKRFSQKVPQQQYDFFIQTTPYFKPTKDYFENLRSLVDTFAQTSSLFAEKSPHIIFFDDQVKNVMGANQSNTDSASFTVLKSQRALSIKNALAACGIIIPQYESSQQRALPE
jgi:hypothetical protein